MVQTGKSLNKNNLKNPTYLQLIGSRLMCELNDLKRTPESAAKELSISEKELKDVIAGQSTKKSAFNIIDKMGEVYPIDNFQLHLLKDDTIDGAVFVSAEDSMKSARVYERLDKDGRLSPYYEYRDTAMSRLAPFKPEWISQLRHVGDSNPDNPSVVMNNGHFMHQVTLFIGPVNFYYEDIDGTTKCKEMNTGDCNYITPFMKHSFTNRSKDEFAYIIACTLGGEVSKAQRDLYALGPKTLDNYVLDYRKNTAGLQLIKQHMNNDFITNDSMNLLLLSRGIDVDIGEYIDGKEKLSEELIDAISDILSLEKGDISFPKYKPQDECIVKYISKSKPHKFPSKKSPLYEIYTLARTSKMPTLRSSIIDVLTKNADIDKCMQNSLHTYMINFGDSPVTTKWEYEGEMFNKILYPNDSIYFKPFVKFAFGNEEDKNARIFVVGTSPVVSLQAQKELSSFVDPIRTIKEMETWFER